MVAPNVLGKRHIQAMISALTDSVIAFRLGRASEDHYHTMIAGVLIADEIANIVHRHKHLRAELKHALDALASIADRVRQRTVDDAYWSATQEEADSLDLAVEIYKALMISTPGQMVRRAMLRVKEQLKSGERNVHNRA